MIVPPPDDYDGMDIQIFPEEDYFNPTEAEYNRIKAHAALPVWICPICNCKNSHDNQRCVYCWIRNKVITDKP